MLPWSVMASAGRFICLHAAIRSLMRQAPSRSEYSVWTWRWTKRGAAIEVVAGLPFVAIGIGECDAAAMAGSLLRASYDLVGDFTRARAAQRIARGAAESSCAIMKR